MALILPQGDREASVLEAEGFSIALEKIYEVAKGVDQNTMSLQYFETLKDMGASESTKWVFPLEFTSFLRPIASAMNGGDSDGNGRSRRDIPSE